MITTSVGTVRPIRTIAAATASVGLAVVLTAVGTSEPFRDSDVAPDWSEWAAFNLPIILGSAVLVFGFVHRVVQRGRPSVARSAVVLAVLSVLSLGVPWTGLPCVLAGGAILAAHEATSHGTSRAAATAAVGLAVATVAGAVAAALFG
jgi:hypothetical protein